MPRPVLEETRLHPAIRHRVAQEQSEIVQSVQEAAAAHAVLVVGMAGNPFCKRARRTLESAGVAHHYVEHGSYLKGWRTRLGLKLWTGWPTFPMVFVRGQLVGGAQDVQRLVESGELRALLAA